MKTLSEHRQRNHVVSDSVTNLSLCTALGTAATCKEPAQHRNAGCSCENVVPFQ